MREAGHLRSPRIHDDELHALIYAFEDHLRDHRMLIRRVCPTYNQYIRVFNLRERIRRGRHPECIA